MIAICLLTIQSYGFKPEAQDRCDPSSRQAGEYSVEWGVCLAMFRDMTRDTTRDTTRDRPAQPLSCSRKRCASSAAMQPVPAEVMAWR
jgi:hypothetical protein